MVFADINEEGAAASAENSKSYASNKEYKALSIKVDVTDPVSVQAMVDFTVRSFGRIDYSVNSAGVCPICTSRMSSWSLIFPVSF